MKKHECKFLCGKEIIFLGKTGEPRSTGFYEIEDGKITDKEHTFSRCDGLRESHKQSSDKIEKRRQEHGGGLDAFSSSS